MAARPAFWRPGTTGPVDREAADAPGVPVYNPNVKLSVQQQRQRLPIYGFRTEILYLVETYPVVVLVGETGSGKTTQVPQYLHEANWTAGGRMVACTQPRRVAATTIAARVAEEMCVRLGEEVGYCVRFDDTSSPRTRVRFMTDGMLVRETMADPLLSRYSVIMVDEAHERTVATDVLLGLLKKILRRRKDLRVIVASATIETDRFLGFFGSDASAAITVEGRMYPVDIHYCERPIANYVQECVRVVSDIAAHEPAGDILVFLTGQQEIETACSLVTDNPSLARDLYVLPLYAGLTHAEQLRCFQRPPAGKRKVVFATNVAETSITIDGIVYVVDCMFVKAKLFDPTTGQERLAVIPEAIATADQRSGRAGRMCPGKSYRLCTEEAFLSSCPRWAVPEMQRADAAPVFLQLKALGIDNVARFDFLTPPPAASAALALELLFALGAIDGDGRLTDGVGARMAELPVAPQMARSLIASAEYGCTHEMTGIAAMMQVQGVFLREGTPAADAARDAFGVREGDMLTLLNVLSAFEQKTAELESSRATNMHGKLTSWCDKHGLGYRALSRAVEVRKQIGRTLSRVGIDANASARARGVLSSEDTTVLRKCIAAGHFAQAARLHPDGRYRALRGGRTLELHPSSVLHGLTQGKLYLQLAAYVVYGEVACVGERELIRDVTAVEEEWLVEVAPHFYKKATVRPEDRVPKRHKP